MAAGTMATAAGAAVLLYVVLSRRLAAKGGSVRSRRISRRPAQAPATWLQTLAALTETLCFIYSETLGKWPIGDLAFGINYLMRTQGNMQVASIYGGGDCVRLRGPEIITELNHLLRLLTLCMFFSKKTFPVFLESAGYSLEDVLIQKPKAGILKPAFTIIRDKESKCFLLLIRGTHSIKDTLTAATGAVVPFHHSVLHDGGIGNLVLGYAHCGMVAAARWIAKLSTPCLLKALSEYPDYKIKIVGHSLGGGTAALLTYILREQEELSSTTCVTFAPAACMTWELAESGKQFIATVINGSDMVPTFSAASVDDLRSEVTASSWLNDLRCQVEHTRVLNVVFRSATVLGSHLPSISSAKARVAGAGALFRPVSTGTQVVMDRAQDVAQAVVRTRSSLTSWTCIGPRRRSVVPTLNSKGDLIEESIVSEASEIIVTEVQRDLIQCELECNSSDIDTGEYDPLISDDIVTATPTIDIEDVTGGELWHELEKELQRREDEIDIRAQEEEAAAVNEITEEENVLADSESPISIADAAPEYHKFYPAGRIWHMVSIPPPSDEEVPAEANAGIYETPRELYSKIRLSRTMINDHYMPMYRKMMELLIRELEDDYGRVDD